MPKRVVSGGRGLVVPGGYVHPHDPVAVEQCVEFVRIPPFGAVTRDPQHIHIGSLADSSDGLITSFR